MGPDMSITGIGSYQNFANTVYSNQTPSVNAVESDGDADRSRVSAPTNASGGSGLFTSAVSQTLFQIGVTPAAANVATGAAPANPQQAALNSFVQNLFGALQVSGNGGAAAPLKKDGKTGASNPTTATPASGTPEITAGSSSTGSPTGATVGSNLESRLQNLIQQLDSGGSGAAGTDAGNVALSSLQQSYEGVLSSQGISGSQAPLSNFLQVLAQNLQDAPPTGNLISITA